MAQGKPAKRPRKPTQAPHNPKAAPKIGKPTRYRPEYDDQASGLALLGLDEEALAKYFTVDVKTLRNWYKSHPSFHHALKKGKEQADIPVVLSLRKRALGFEHRIKGPILVKANGEIERDTNGDPIHQEIPQYFPPDVSAIRYWLGNRHPKQWKERQDIQQTSTVSIQSTAEARKNLEDIFNAPKDQAPVSDFIRNK